MLASQPWRARMSAEFKAQKVLAPLARSLAPGGRLLAIQSYGHDPGLEIVQRLWPGENPFQVDRHELLAALKTELGRDARDFTLARAARRQGDLPLRDAHAAVGDRRSHRHLDAVRGLERRHLRQPDRGRAPRSVVSNGAYLEATQEVLQKHGGLWFNDETFVVANRRP